MSTEALLSKVTCCIYNQYSKDLYLNISYKSWELRTITENSESRREKEKALRILDIEEERSPEFVAVTCAFSYD
ncbi:4481_t:CDS:2 [Funneliformis mosseae]|uniref:4481_t:CDS:1 n=1 Tax=Funneliformis mosseae TaxID=27381 RepID=A0A9N9E7L4_FUNMO|nr:4481_t:CDS:2 [Funneliformis mosseae]